MKIILQIVMTIMIVMLAQLIAFRFPNATFIIAFISGGLSVGLGMLLIHILN